MHSFHDPGKETPAGGQLILPRAGPASSSSLFFFGVAMHHTAALGPVVYTMRADVMQDLAWEEE